MSSAIDPLPRGTSGSRPRPLRSQSAVRMAAGRSSAVAAPVEEAGLIDTVALRRQIPAWAVSMLVHVVALLALALFVSRPDELPKATPSDVALATVAGLIEPTLPSDLPVTAASPALESQLPGCRRG